MESDKQFDNSVWAKISHKIKVVVPTYKFNYNQFLNIALEHCTAELVCISNNDVVAKDHCVSMMCEFFNRVPTLMSASPVDRTWHQNSYEIFPEDNKFYAGYETTKHLLGFCVFLRRSIFDVIGPFDERFHFYHQDNDLEMCLRAHKLLHVILTMCHIEHGHDKPESLEDHSVVRQKLLGSQAVFYQKWGRPLNMNLFKKYKKLSIVTNTNTPPVNEYVEVVEKLEDASGQYTICSDVLIDRDEQQRLLDVIGYKPTQVNINNMQITRNF